MTFANSGVTPAPARLRKDQVSVPACAMSVYEAIFNRRMTEAFQERDVPRQAVERLLEAAVWAPNHRMTEPWRFFVIPKDSAKRSEAAQLAYEYDLQAYGDTKRAEATRQKMLNPPVVVYVFAVRGPDEETTQENYAATCCAVQNVCLAGAAEGLSVSWNTGGRTRHPKLRQALGAGEDWALVGLLSIGYPAQTPNTSRTPASQFAEWLE